MATNASLVEMKHLPKHLRPRYRYLAVELETTPDATFDRGAFQRHLWYTAQNLLGDVGSAELDLSVLRFERDGPTAVTVVRCRRGEQARARAVLACVSAVEETSVRTAVRGVSGTVRACEEKYLSGPRGVSGERTVAFADADRRALSRGECIDVCVGSGFVGATNLDTND